MKKTWMNIVWKAMIGGLVTILFCFLIFFWVVKFSSRIRSLGATYLILRTPIFVCLVFSSPSSALPFFLFFAIKGFFLIKIKEIVYIYGSTLSTLTF